MRDVGENNSSSRTILAPGVRIDRFGTEGFKAVEAGLET
jgi:hypothetical protein